MITRIEKVQATREWAGAECDDRLAEIIVDLLEERGYEWVRSEYGPRLEPTPNEEEWLAILDEACRRAEEDA